MLTVSATRDPLPNRGSEWRNRHLFIFEQMFDAVNRKRALCGFAEDGPGMSSKLTEVAVDCADPQRLARFWCAVLDYEVQDEEDDSITIGSPGVPEGRRRSGPVPPTLTFARVPEPKTVKNRLHLDLNATDREQPDEVRRLLDLGARLADVGQGDDDSWVVLADPEGNEFCVLAGRYP
jgi:hypothetical protein